MGGLEWRSVQVCRFWPRSLPVPLILYSFGPETPEGPKGQHAPNTSGKPPAPPWVSPMGRGDPVLRKAAPSPMERQKPGTVTDQRTQLRAPLSLLLEPALSTGVGIRKPCSPRRPEAEFRGRGSPPRSPIPADTPSGIQGRPQLLYSGPSSEKWPRLFPVPGPTHSHF